MDAVIEAGPYGGTWESLSRYRVPQWYRDAKFGIFLHWGAFSVPAFGNEWYPRTMYRRGTPAFEHHVATYGRHDRFGYKDFGAPRPATSSRCQALLGQANAQTRAGLPKTCHP
ncbi:alpha-L-fucosidase [Promicromonospora panici]|uniref:alpha-L-fucosidase n=1 Tax=Promicromonospora panici TaxID=2219658 RepID=UPI001F5E05E0|nr:alpha-L-fucosidase [Promicromonospora panici]